MKVFDRRVCMKVFDRRVYESVWSLSFYCSIAVASVTASIVRRLLFVLGRVYESVLSAVCVNRSPSFIIDVIFLPLKVLLKARVDRSSSKAVVLHSQQLHHGRCQSFVSWSSWSVDRIYRVRKGSRCLRHAASPRDGCFQRPQEAWPSKNRYRTSSLYSYSSFRSKRWILQERWWLDRSGRVSRWEVNSMWLRSFQTISPRRHCRPWGTRRTPQQGLGHV